MDTLIFCQNVKALRLICNISKRGMARIMKIAPRTLSKIENGIMPPKVSYEIILRLAQYFFVRPSLLFTPLVEWGDDEPSAHKETPW